MGILPMSLTGVPPVSYLLLFLSAKEEKEEAEETTGTGKMPVRLMGGTPMLRFSSHQTVETPPHTGYECPRQEWRFNRRVVLEEAVIAFSFGAKNV
jgi:hypothetical protein